MPLDLLRCWRGVVGGVRRVRNLACWSRMVFCWASSFWRRVVLSSVMAAACSVAVSSAPSKLLVYSRSACWLAGDKEELMLNGTCGGLLDSNFMSVGISLDSLIKIFSKSLTI